MATTKTLTPTNVTIQIPEFTDQPDQRVNSNCIDKEADAINALNSKIPTVSIGNSFSITTNDKGIVAVPSENIPTVSGKTRAMVSLANVSSTNLSASQIPPTVLETSNGTVYILGSPDKTYNTLQIRGLFI